MAERISGSDVYVTHEKMSTYLNQLLGGALAMVITVVGATWYLSGEIGEVKRDIAVIKSHMELPVGGGNGADAHATAVVQVQSPGQPLKQFVLRSEELAHNRTRGELDAR